MNKDAIDYWRIGFDVCKQMVLDNLRKYKRDCVILGKDPEGVFSMRMDTAIQLVESLDAQEELESRLHVNHYNS